MTSETLAPNTRSAQVQDAPCAECRETSGYVLVNGIARLCECRKRQHNEPRQAPKPQPRTRATRRPATADSQFALIHDLLRQRGERGIDTLELIHRYHVVRPGARIAELRQAGVEIETKQDAHGVATYILRGEPAQLAALRVYGKQPIQGQRDLFAESTR